LALWNAHEPTFDFFFFVRQKTAYEIDTGGGTWTVTFVGGGTASATFDTTNSSGDSAEFHGYVVDGGGPLITRVSYNTAGGDGEWGLDNLEYSTPVPEPGTMAALALGLAAFSRRKARR